MAVAVCGLLIGVSVMTSCEDDVLTGQPEWLGNSIYERLQEDGNYTTMLRLIDDMGQKEILSRTGSKTLFVADDAAFDEWFKTNTWGARNYDQLTLSQRRMLLNSAMINNAYLIELLSSVKGNPPQQGKCMRRPSAISYTDSIPLIYPEDMPSTPAWKEHKGRTEGMYLFKDLTDQPMIHFLPAFMRTNKITSEDLEKLTNGAASSIDEAWVNGMRVSERDITCKNGYIQKVDGVLESAPNMAEIIRQHKSTMSRWSRLIDRYSAPYYRGGLYINEAGRQVDIDSVFELRYFADRGRLGSNEVYPDGVTTAQATLKFDPGWNGYYLKSSDGIYTDAAAMIVPSNTALDYWWEHDGAALKEQYKEWDSIPDLVLSQLINVNMLTSLVDAVPSKFSSILDDSKMEMGIKPADVDSCFMGCNGVVYLTNQVFTPRAFSSVSFPALIHNDVMSIIYWAITNLDFAPYLNSMESRYSLIIPNNTAMLSYIDPTTYGESTQILYEFTYDESAVQANRIKARRWKIALDEEGNWQKTGLIGETTSNPSERTNGVNLVRNRLEDLMNSLIIVGDIEDGHEYYKTKGGTMIHVENAGTAQMTISGGLQLEENKPVPVTTIYDMSKSGNGKTYILEAEPVMNSATSVYATLNANPEFEEFRKLISGSDGNVKHDLLVAESGSGSNIYRAIDMNVRLFDKYNYTVYVPTNESIQQLINDGYLPTWDDFDAQTLEAWNDNDSLMTEAKTAIANRIINFVRYHIQDNSVFIGAKDTYAESAEGTRYETAKLNPLNNRFFALEVKLNNGSRTMTVKDQLGNTREVMTAGGLYNLMCREYWFSGGKAGSTGRSINSASDAVVHQINGVLLFDNSLTSKTWQQELDEIRNAN
jgi:hypothetical protein